MESKKLSREEFMVDEPIRIESECQQAYDSWIKANVEGDGYGQCDEITQGMVEAFPELTRVRGHYYDMCWGQREHWWLKTTDGEIVDPTSEQFPTKGRGVYDEWDESRPEPVGTCYHCGSYMYSYEVCPNECEDPDGFYDRLAGLTTW